MKKIELGQKNSVHDYQGIYENCVIDFDTKVEKQPIALKCNGEVFGSYGDFSCIVGHSKSMKTVLKNAIIASYIGGRTNNYFEGFTGIGSKDKIVLDLDTEQSPYHVKRNVSMIWRLYGSKYNGYKAFNLRKNSIDQRYGFLRWILLESEFAGNVGLICVDGAADLVKSVNDELASYELAQMFMELTAEAKCHMVTVLHKNSMGSKATGHLGSAIMKKAETVAILKKQSDGYINVTAEFTRNKPFDDFQFKLNEKALPQTKGNEDNLFEDDAETPF